MCGKVKAYSLPGKAGENDERDQNAQLPSSEDHVEAIDEPETSISSESKNCHCGWNGACPTDDKEVRNN